MSVLRQLNILGQMRLDVPHIRSVESSIAADFDVMAGRVQAGEKAVVIRGFALANFTAGTAANSVQLTTADGILYNMNASEAGTFLWVSADRDVETLNSATNARVSGSFTAGQVNYIGLDLTRSADSTTADLVQFLDPNTLLENAKNVPLGRTLDYRIVISTTPFSASPNLVPIAKIKTDASNNVDSASGSVQDARNILWRLGSGGDFPNRYSSFNWAQNRVESVTGSGIFVGGDKSIQSQKDWMDAIMTRIWELGGGENWYSTTADRNVRMVRAPSPVFATTGDNFEWIGGANLHWQSLKIAFDNSNTASVYYNTVVDQTGDSTGLTNLADGDCIYVDLDRTANSAVTAKKAALQTLSVPSIPGSRFVIAWRIGANVYTRDASLAVNVSFQPATTTVAGAVRLNETPNPTHAGSGVPTVPVLNATNSITIGMGSYPISGSATAITAVGGPSNGIGIQGTGGGTYGSAGVKGIHASAGATGVHGTSSTYYAVIGDAATSGYGTGGFSVTGIGAVGWASGTNGKGVWGNGGPDSAFSSAYGIYGTSNSRAEAGFFLGWQPSGAGISADGGPGGNFTAGYGSDVTMGTPRAGGLGLYVGGGNGSATNNGGAGGDGTKSYGGHGGTATSNPSGSGGAAGRGLYSEGGAGGGTTSPYNAATGGIGGEFKGGSGGYQSFLLYGTGGAGIVTVGGVGGNLSGANSNGHGIISTGGGNGGTGGNIGGWGGIFTGAGGGIVSIPGGAAQFTGGNNGSSGIGAVGILVNGGNGGSAGQGGIGVNSTGGNAGGGGNQGGTGVKGTGGTGGGASGGGGYGIMGQGGVSVGAIQSGHGGHFTGGAPGSGAAGYGIYAKGGTGNYAVYADGGTTNGSGVFSTTDGSGHSFIASPASSGKALAILNTSATVSYTGGKTMKKIFSGARFKALCSADNMLDRILYDGPYVNASRLGFSGTGTSTQITLYTDFALPLNAVITGVRIALDHGGTSAGLTANVSFNKITRSDTLGAPPYGWTSVPVLNNGGGGGGINLSLSAPASSQVLTMTVNATASNRTVNSNEDMFALEFDFLTTNNYWYLVWFEITYTLFDTLSW